MNVRGIKQVAKSFVFGCTAESISHLVDHEPIVTDMPSRIPMQGQSQNFKNWFSVLNVDLGATGM